MICTLHTNSALAIALLLVLYGSAAPGGDIEVSENESQIEIVTPKLKALIRKEGYVSGVAGGTFLDRKTGFRDAGFGLDIVDWIMEPGSDEKYRDQLEDHMVYKTDNAYHGNRAKRMIEGPQICTKARKLSPSTIQGDDFVAIQQSFSYNVAPPGKKTGSKWTQTIVFPAGKRYFVSCDRIDSVNESDGMFLRVDMPGHIKHDKGDTFSRVYLSYLQQTNRPTGFKGDTIPASSFDRDFAPDAWFNYRRDRIEDAGKPVPNRFIRAYQLRDPKTGKDGPWLAGMTLDPSVVHEAWCHQRGYICMIEEFGGRPIKAGESFSAAFIVGYFDSIEEMNTVYDQYKGHTGLTVDKNSWNLVK